MYKAICYFWLVQVKNGPVSTGLFYSSENRVKESGSEFTGTANFYYETLPTIQGHHGYRILNHHFVGCWTYLGLLGQDLLIGMIRKARYWLFGYRGFAYTNSRGGFQDLDSVFGWCRVSINHLIQTYFIHLHKIQAQNCPTFAFIIYRCNRKITLQLLIITTQSFETIS